MKMVVLAVVVIVMVVVVVVIVVVLFLFDLFSVRIFLFYHNFLKKVISSYKVLTNIGVHILDFFLLNFFLIDFFPWN